MSGTILALSIISSIFLVANFQGHELGTSVIKEFQPPITITSNSNSMNITQYDQLAGIVQEADALGTNIVKNVTRHFYMASMTYGYNNDSYFITKNTTINWLTFYYNSSIFSNVEYSVNDNFDYLPAAAIISGRAPENPKEILLTASFASKLSIAVDEIISIGDYGPNKLETGFKVVGLVSAEYSFFDSIIIDYTDFHSMIDTISTNGMIALGFGYYYNLNVLSVYINIDNVNIYDLNDIITKITNLETRVATGLNNKNLDFAAVNSAQYLSSQYVLLMIFLYVIMYLALLIVLLLPVIVLSNYVSQTIGLEMFEKRSIEFGQFRSRGFSRKQMNKVLMSEVFVSTVFCSVLSSGIGIGISYLMIPIIGTVSLVSGASTSMPLYNPFFNLETIVIFTVMVILLSFLFVLSVYVRPMELSYSREMIDTLKEKIKARRREKSVVAGIVFMFLIGGIPLAFYLILQALASIPSVSMVFYSFGPLISILAMFSPFFISLATIKLLGEKKPKRFAQMCTAFFKTSKNQLKHVITRNISNKSEKISKLMLIIAFTVAFGLTVRLSGESLVNFKAERINILLGSDVRTTYNGNLGDLQSFKISINSKVNVSSSYSIVETYGKISNLDDSRFTYMSFSIYMLDLASMINTCRILDDKFLVDTSWMKLTDAANNHEKIALLPSALKPYIQETSVTVVIDTYNSPGNTTQITQELPIAGYFKAFPAIDYLPTSSSSYYGSYYPLVLNVNPWDLFGTNGTMNFNMVVSIKTPFNDQPTIDEAAADMNLPSYITASNSTSVSSPLSFSPLVDNPLFYGLLDIDYWLILGISLFGIGALTFMKITSERKEIGLFRIRGFDNKMIYKIQLSEKYMPVVISSIFGTIAGFISAILVTTNVALNFSMYNSLINYPIAMAFTIGDMFLLILIPVLLYLLVTVIAIKLELRQNLSSIMDEED